MTSGRPRCPLKSVGWAFASPVCEAWFTPSITQATTTQTTCAYAEIFPWTRPASNGQPDGLPNGQGTNATASGGENGSTRSHRCQAAIGPPSDNATGGAGQATAPVEHVSSFFLALSFAAGLSHFDLTPCTREWVEKVNFWGGRTPGEEKERKN